LHLVGLPLGVFVLARLFAMLLELWPRKRRPRSAERTPDARAWTAADVERKGGRA